MYKLNEFIEDHINFSLDFCAKCIRKYDDFFPFSFYIIEKKIFVIEPSDLSKSPEFNHLINELKTKGLELLQSNTANGYCVGYPSRIKIEDNYYNALSIYIKIADDQQNFKELIYHFPFTKVQDFNYLFDLVQIIEEHN